MCKKDVNQMLDAKRETVAPEQTVTNTDGNWDYHLDPGNDVKDNDTVTDVCEQTQENVQSSEDAGRALDKPSSSGCLERPKRNVRPPQRLDL